ncbi:unnamed protein product [Rangifer tarandus platyrhynchus]|uniref:Uncharacterized protein n=2 Tax=Rangifer tarandus platyrhynchus TaxID=3082113 RepID=A0ACB0FGM2_RANTA|nr:unnamed protein product [Rangifer tarandus platyrhynchus]CAI9711374.1 unnamed protein product [Rangifer tarandus platyrhynchus]
MWVQHPEMLPASSDRRRRGCRGQARRLNSRPSTDNNSPHLVSTQPLEGNRMLEADHLICKRSKPHTAFPGAGSAEGGCRLEPGPACAPASGAEAGAVIPASGAQNPG